MLIEEVAAMLHGKREFVCIDLETTGISARSSRVIEIGAVRFNSKGQLTREFSSLVFPGDGYLHGAEYIHGISQREVEAAPPVAAVLGQLIDFVGDRVVVAHNLPFENRFLGSELERAKLEPGDTVGFCTYSAARRLVSTSTNHKLATLAQHFGIRQPSSHRALPDAKVGALLAFKLLQLVASGAELPARRPTTKSTANKSPAPSRLAAVRQGYRPRWKPSEEQDAILEAFFGTGDIKILAGAGTGKTTTLQLLANSTKSKITYLTFNKATAVEARGRFANNVSATTIHAFAHADLIGQGKSGWLRRLQLGVEPISVTAERLGALEPGFIEALSSPEVSRQVTPHEVTRMAVDTVINFCHSSSRKILARHASTGRAASNLRPALTPLVLLMAEEHWANILDENVTDMPILHDHYLKAWLLGDPDLGPSDGILFVDEAQDLSPAVAKVVQAQRHLKKVFVGDPNQSIYGFAGGKDALATIAAAHILPLTTSWRFGEDAAVIANGWLRTLCAPHPVRSSPAQSTFIGRCDQPDAVLTRTNAMAVWELMELQRTGRSATLQCDLPAILALLDGADDLMNGRWPRHGTLRRFAAWPDVLEHVRHESGAHELVTWVRLIEGFGVRTLKTAVTAATASSDGGAVVSTAHKAKGLEWDSVRIADDFADKLAKAALLGGKEQLAEEKRLAYVAVTRARHRLDPGPLARFADFLN
jgi:DNA polymerase III epsilon subunit family exonuclease